MSASLSRQKRRVMARYVDQADRVVASDCQFFKRYPDWTYSVRPLSHAERAQIETLQGLINLQPDAPIPLTGIKQLAPGVQHRFAVFSPINGIGETWTEVEARSVWGGFASAHSETRARRRMPDTFQLSGPPHQGGAA